MPVTQTYWGVYGEQDEEGASVYVYDIVVGTETIEASKWILVSADNADLASANNMHYVEVYVPFQGNNVVFPHQSTNLVTIGGVFIFNGQNNAFEIDANSYNFVSGTTPQQGATANYTATSTLENSQTAKLFWNGVYTLTVVPEDAAKGVSKIKNISNKLSTAKTLNLKK